MEVTRHLRVGCEFIHQSEIAIPAVFQVEPLSDQKVDVIDERWSLEPEGPTHPYTDLYGNPCRRLMVPAGRSVISYQATVIVPDAVEDADEDAPELTPDQLPDEALIYTLPSRFCLPDVLGAEAWSRFGSRRPATVGCRRSAITCTVTSALNMAPAPRCHSRRCPYQRLWSLPGLHTSRGFVLPRAQHPRSLRLRLPARDRRPPRDLPMDFAAWMEVYLGDRWWTFDPRNNERRKGGCSSGAVAMPVMLRWPPPLARLCWNR